jgi:mannose-6-phosphate isomerase-like protein (cupin superfamily)
MKKMLASIAAALAIAAAPASAQKAPPHYEAAPGVYKVIAENDRFRIVEATWKPGQRDAWHSHPASGSAYRLTDCRSRIYTPDGKFEDRDAKAGSVNFNPPIGVHSFKNVGTAACKALIVERK